MRRTTPALAALSLALVVTLTGCFANPLDQLTEGLIEGGVEQLIENETGVEVDLNGTGASLPSSWPAEVPTLQGDVQFSAAAEGSYTASILVGSLATAQQAFTDITDAGFTQTSELQLGEGAESRTFENDTYVVVVFFTANDDGTATVQYQINAKQ